MGITSDQHASYKLLARELTSRGYTVSEERDGDRLYVNYISPKGLIWRPRAAMIDYPFTTPTVRALSRNKFEATKYVSQRGINVPETIKICDNDDGMLRATNFLKQYEKLVIKPLNRSLSVGLTTDVTTTRKLENAIKKATKYSDEILVQNQVFGEEVRFALLNGRVISALLRQTPRVSGDGVSTVRQLIDRENNERKKINYTIVPYPQITDELIHKSVRMDMVPELGAIVELSRATMISRGCSVYDVLDSVDPSYVRLVESLVKNLDAGFIVVDIFIRNYHDSASRDNYWFIEFNTSPVLKLFYSCRDGNMHDIVPQLAEAIDKEVHSTPKTIVGSFEKVSIPSLGVTKWIAKVDTGAYSGAIGCRSIQVVKKGGKRILQFSPGRKSKRVYETDTYYEKYVRSSNGIREKRYLIDTTIDVGGRTYPMVVSLSVRSEMKHEILIGRRFLRENNLLVDVSLNQEYDTDSEAK